MPHPRISFASRKDRKVWCRFAFSPNLLLWEHILWVRGAMETPSSTARGQSMCAHWNFHRNEILRPYPSSTSPSSTWSSSLDSGMVAVTITSASCTKTAVRSWGIEDLKADPCNNEGLFKPIKPIDAEILDQRISGSSLSFEQPGGFWTLIILSRQLPFGWIPMFKACRVDPGM